MHVMIFGAAGMIGRKLTERLGKDGRLGEQAISRLSLVDVVEAAQPAGFKGEVAIETRRCEVHSFPKR